MYLKLKTPFDPGMNDPGKTYPLIYITQMVDNPGGGNFSFIYEAGDFVTVPGVDLEDGTSTPDIQAWSKGAGCMSQNAVVSGDDYVKATQSPVLKPSDSAYQSIRRILYTKLIASGLDGTIEET